MNKIQILKRLIFAILKISRKLDYKFQGIIPIKDYLTLFSYYCESLSIANLELPQEHYVHFALALMERGETI
jgi:hypothetical protein